MKGVTVLNTGDYVCPYNNSHCVRPLRFQIHLLKCRKLHESVMSMFVCPYNAKHHVPTPEAQMHVAQCPDKAYVDAHQHGCNELRKTGSHGSTATPGYLDSSDVFQELDEDHESSILAVRNDVVDDGFPARDFRATFKHRTETILEDCSKYRISKITEDAAKYHGSSRAEPTSRYRGDSSSTKYQGGSRGYSGYRRSSVSENADFDFDAFVSFHRDDNPNQESDNEHRRVKTRSRPNPEPIEKVVQNRQLSLDIDDIFSLSSEDESGMWWENIPPSSQMQDYEESDEEATKLESNHASAKINNKHDLGSNHVSVKVTHELDGYIKAYAKDPVTKNCELEEKLQNGEDVLLPCLQKDGNESGRFKTLSKDVEDMFSFSSDEEEGIMWWETNNSISSQRDAEDLDFINAPINKPAVQSKRPDQFSSKDLSYIEKQRYAQFQDVGKVENLAKDLLNLKSISSCDDLVFIKAPIPKPGMQSKTFQLESTANEYLEAGPKKVSDQFSSLISSNDLSYSEKQRCAKVQDVDTIENLANGVLNLKSNVLISSNELGCSENIINISSPSYAQVSDVGKRENLTNGVLNLKSNMECRVSGNVSVGIISNSMKGSLPPPGRGRAYLLLKALNKC